MHRLAQHERIPSLISLSSSTHPELAEGYRTPSSACWTNGPNQVQESLVTINRIRGSLTLHATGAVFALCFHATAAYAFSTGVTTLSFGPNGCNQCHFGGSAPTVELTGPTQVAPESTNEYTLRVGTVGDQNKAGLNVSGTDGVLATGGNDAATTETEIGTGNREEITQSAAKAAVDGTVTFTFLWTAPLSGDVVLTAWGNAVNGNFTRSGDLAASTTLTIFVGSTPPPATPTPTPSPTPTAIAACVGDCDGSGDVTVNEIIILVK